MLDYVKESALEHQFWLQVLGDHARFILSNLAPKEKELIDMATKFKNSFDALLKQACVEMDVAGWKSFAVQVLPEVQAFRSFKLELIRRHLFKKVEIGLTPTFINHMVNEIEEYLKNLTYLTKGEIIPLRSPVHHHLLWLKDAEGHAGAVYCELDYTQTKLRLAAKDFMELFLKRYSDTVEYAGFLRTGIPMFPSLSRFDKKVAGEICEFKEYLELLKLMVKEAKVIGTLNPLIPDHMAREECYYLYKLHRSDPKSVSAPKCDPTRPRVSE